MTVQELRRVAIIGAFTFAACAVFVVVQRAVTGNWFEAFVFSPMVGIWGWTTYRAWKFGKSSGKGVE